MKNLVMKVFVSALFFSSFIFSNSVMAKEISKQCYDQAASAAEELANGGYDENGFWAFDCRLADNKKVVVCDVGASKGNGDATDTYRVVLNKSCTHVFRVELTGEE